MVNITRHLRRGIAMVELIFAIVVMGIALLSAPMLVSTSVNSGYVAIQQESIANVASEIGMIMTYQWDQASTVLEGNGCILSTTNGHADLGTRVAALAPPFLDRRGGTTANSNRVFCPAGERNATAALGYEYTSPTNDIDDFITENARAGLVDMNASTNSRLVGDAIDQDVTMEVAVSYISDDPTSGDYLGTSRTIRLNNPFNTPVTGGGTSNIKMIQVALSTTSDVAELNKTIIMRAFSCNIGTYGDLNRRVFP